MDMTGAKSDDGRFEHRGHNLTMMNRIAELASRPSCKALVVVTVVAVLTAIAAYAGIKASLNYGRLAAPPSYDDVMYFIWAAQWLIDWPDRSTGQSLLALLKQHAPYSTISAIIGFLWTPDSYVGHYAINFVPVGVFLFGIAWLVRDASLLNIVTCLVGVACVPLIIQTVNEARPDLPWGLAMGLAMGGIVYRRLTDRPVWSVALLGILCGFAVLIKPSALPASTFCVGFALLVSAATDWFGQGRKPTFRSSALRILVFGAAFVLAATPLLIVSFGHIWRYVWSTLIVQKEFWAYRAGLNDHLLFYIQGPGGGHISLGYWFQVGLALFAVRIGLAAWLDRNDLVRVIPLVLAVAVTYAVPTATPVKSYFLGAMFYSTFIMSMVLNYTAIATLLSKRTNDSRSLARSGILAVRIGMLLLLMALFQTPVLAGMPRLATVFGTVAHDMRSSVDQLWSLTSSRALELHRTAKNPLVVSFSSPHPANPSVLQLYAIRYGIPATFNGEFFLGQFDAAVNALAKADMAVVTSTIGHNLPVPTMGDDLIRALGERPDMCLVKSLQFDGTLRQRVYQRRELGCPPPAGN
jgi:hypothetical protein